MRILLIGLFLVGCSRGFDVEVNGVKVHGDMMPSSKVEAQAMKDEILYQLRQAEGK